MNSIATFFRESRTGRFLIPLGMILIIFSIFVFIANEHNKNYIPIEAIVSKTELYEEAYTDVDGNYVEATYTVYVKYTVNEREYNVALGEFSGYKKGDKIKIAYNPENPEEITQQTGIILPIAMFIGGIVALIWGVISFIKVIKKHKEMKNQEKGWSN